MHIVKLLTKINETGLTTNTLDLTEAFIQKGHRVTLFIGRDNYQNAGLHYLEKRFLASGANIVWFENVDKANTFQKVYQTLVLLRKLSKLKCDIIHVQSPYLSFIPYLLNKKFVSTLHVADLPHRFEYKNATRVIAISRETKDYGIRHFGYKESQIDLILHGVSKRYQNSISSREKHVLKEKFSIPSDSLIIGIVASIEKRKGHDVLLEAIQHLKISGVNYKVLIVGSSKSENEKEWLENLIIQTKTEDRIVQIPYQDPKPFYDIMDIFVLPSRLEGFPLVAIEAFLSGCCLVRSNVEGAYDQIEHGKTGFLFENENVIELKNILEKLINDDRLRMEVAKNGREFALKNFTSDIMAEKTLEVYQKVINL